MLFNNYQKIIPFKQVYIWINRAMSIKKRETLYFESDREWREWLFINHETSTGIYLILYSVNSETPSMRWEEAVRVSLCFGWIDSTTKRIDEEKRQQLFTPRKSKSVWSR